MLHRFGAETPRPAPGHVLDFNPDIDVAQMAWEFLSPFRLSTQ